MPKEQITRFASQQQINRHNPLAPLPSDGSHNALESAFKDAQLAFLAPDALRSIPQTRTVNRQSLDHAGLHHVPEASTMAYEIPPHIGGTLSQQVHVADGQLYQEPQKEPPPSDIQTRNIYQQHHLRSQRIQQSLSGPSRASPQATKSRTNEPRISISPIRVPQNGRSGATARGSRSPQIHRPLLPGPSPNHSTSRNMVRARPKPDTAGFPSTAIRDALPAAGEPPGRAIQGHTINESSTNSPVVRLAPSTANSGSMVDLSRGTTSTPTFRYTKDTPGGSFGIITQGDHQPRHASQARVSFPNGADECLHGYRLYVITEKPFPHSQTIASLIRKHGGRILDHLVDECDYVVVGVNSPPKRYGLKSELNLVDTLEIPIINIEGLYHLFLTLPRGGRPWVDRENAGRGNRLHPQASSSAISEPERTVDERARGGHKVIPSVEEDVGENNRPKSRSDAAMHVDDGGGDDDDDENDDSSEEDESSETSDEDSGLDRISRLEADYTPHSGRDNIRLSARERAVLRRREKEDARLAGGRAGNEHDRRIEVALAGTTRIDQVRAAGGYTTPPTEGAREKLRLLKYRGGRCAGFSPMETEYSSDEPSDGETQAMQSEKGYLIQVKLQGSSLTRILRVPASLTFLKLAKVIQIAMDRSNKSAWKFLVCQLPHPTYRCVRSTNVGRRILYLTEKATENDGYDFITPHSYKLKKAKDFKLQDIWSSQQSAERGFEVHFNLNHGFVSLQDYNNVVTFLGEAADGLRSAMRMPAGRKVWCISGEGNPIQVEEYGERKHKWDIQRVNRELAQRVRL